MKYVVVAIRDDKTGFFSPQCEPNEASAVRNFEHAVTSRPDSLFFTHPADYSLFRVGAFDSETGVIESCLPEPIVTAAQVLSLPGGGDSSAR